MRSARMLLRDQAASGQAVLCVEGTHCKAIIKKILDKAIKLPLLPFYNFLKILF